MYFFINVFNLQFFFQGIKQLHRFKIKHPNIDVEPHISKTTKYFQDYIHRKLAAIEDNLKSCLVEPNGSVIYLFLMLNLIYLIIYSFIFFRKQ